MEFSTVENDWWLTQREAEEKVGMRVRIVIGFPYPIVRPGILGEVVSVIPSQPPGEGYGVIILFDSSTIPRATVEAMLMANSQVFRGAFERSHIFTRAEHERHLVECRLILNLPKRDSWRRPMGFFPVAGGSVFLVNFFLTTSWERSRRNSLVLRLFFAIL